jgi:hypothetical protein
VAESKLLLYKKEKEKVTFESNKIAQFQKI